MTDALEALRGKLIVSCQAWEGDPLDDADVMARFARAAVGAGAGGIRANGTRDVAAIRAAVRVPIIAIDKRKQDDGRILITPSLEGALALVQAGADAVAFDCTARGQRSGALERLRKFREQSGVPAFADIATLEEARQAIEAGADAVLSTMRGYTAETEHVRDFDLAFLRELVRASAVPVIAEGRIGTPEQAAAALAAGAFAVVVGGAITRTGDIARGFVAAADHETRRGAAHVIGIDLGGTDTKFAIADREGDLSAEGACPTPAFAGQEALLGHLESVARHLLDSGVSVRAVGIATAGWVDPNEGRVVYATGNLPGWTGAGIRRQLESALELPVAVENDANALAVGERHFGAAVGVDDFACITLGTGVGGGCYIAGRLNRGPHFLANGLGHIPVEPEGLPCNCGCRGCLEQYSNAAALVRYAGGGFPSAEAVMRAARAGDTQAREAVRTYAGWLARGCSVLMNLLDPELIVLAGGIARENHMLLADLEAALKGSVNAWQQRRLRLALSPLARYGGVLGAAAAALNL